MAKRRADVIMANDLSKSIDKAVALATKRLKLNPQRANITMNWEIFGRRLRGVRDVDVAFEFANEVTQSMRLRGLKADPIVARIDRELLVGYIERSRIPYQLGSARLD